jgi:hypothetical protein
VQHRTSRQTPEYRADTPVVYRISNIGAKELEESPDGRWRGDKKGRTLGQNRTGNGLLTNYG